ncbi:MAG TPA: PAS domain S-box protein, partial [Fusibacter sp.]|nr:PAS domain S-box protein [Fusibacter sp.]
VMLSDQSTKTALGSINRSQYYAFDCTPYFMIATNPQGIIQGFNRAAERLLGYAAEEVIGELTPIAFHDSAELLQDCNFQIDQAHHHTQPGIELLLAKARQGISDEAEWTYISKQGDRIPVNVTITSLQDEDSNHLGFLLSGQDLRQQKQAEIVAQTADRHFRRMVANVPGMIYQYVQCADGTGFFPFVGYNCSSMFDVSPELVQQDADVFWRMVHPDDFFAFKVASSLAGKTLQSCEVELKVRIPDGRSKWIVSIARPTQQSNGNLIWDGVMIDISDRKRLEAERDRFFNLPLDILGVLHSNGIFRQVNTAITDILGHSVSSLTSMPLVELVHPEDRYTTRTAINRLSEGITECFEVRCRCQDGTYKWIAWKAIPINETHLIYAIGRDITATKAAEAKIIQLNHELERRVQERTHELQRTYQQLSFLIENFQLALIEWDADFRIQQWSPEAEKLFGWTAGNVVGKSPQDWQLIHEDDTAIAQQTIQALLDGTQTHGTYSVRNYTHNKAIIYCEWFHSALIDDSGQLIAILSLVVDRTTRKQAEDELKASQHRFSTAFERSPAALSITTFPDGIQMDVNESWVVSTGYSREEAIGRKSSELQFWEFQTEKEEFIQQLNQY